MSRLYDMKYDENRWKVKKIDDRNYNTYKIIDKEQDEIYFFRNIIGAEQVTEDEFLVHRRYNRDKLIIERCKLENSEIEKTFAKDFSRFNFITDDRIIFTNCDNSGRYRCSGVYSIKDNCNIQDSEWLRGKIIETIYYDENNDNISLFVDIENYSAIVGTTDILFRVNPDTLEPESECYSSLRDSFIKVNNKDDINRIVIEDKKYIRIIEDHLYETEKNKFKRIKEKILRKNT